jgi:hypothetical protein
LSTLFNARDENGFEIGACSIDGSTIAGWSGAENQNMSVFGSWHKNNLVIKIDLIGLVIGLPMNDSCISHISAYGEISTITLFIE